MKPEIRRNAQRQAIETIIQERLRRGLTQGQVADLIGMHRIKYHRIETQSSVLKADIAHQIEVALGINLNMGPAI